MSSRVHISARVETIEMLILVNGQIIIAEGVIYIISNAGLVSTETLGKQSLMRDVRQCDPCEWEAAEMQKAVRTRQVYVQWRIPEIEQMLSWRGVDAGSESKDAVLQRPEKTAGRRQRRAADVS